MAAACRYGKIIIVAKLWPHEWFVCSVHLLVHQYTLINQTEHKKNILVTFYLRCGLLKPRTGRKVEITK